MGLCHCFFCLLILCYYFSVSAVFSLDDCRFFACPRGFLLQRSTTAMPQSLEIIKKKKQTQAYRIYNSRWDILWPMQWNNFPTVKLHCVIQELLSALCKKDFWFNTLSCLLTARLLKPSPTPSRCKDVQSHKQIEKKEHVPCERELFVRLERSNSNFCAFTLRRKGHLCPFPMS